jgi:hypothetical protein
LQHCSYSFINFTIIGRVAGFSGSCESTREEMESSTAAPQLGGDGVGNGSDSGNAKKPHFNTMTVGPEITYIQDEEVMIDGSELRRKKLVQRLVWKVDWRLCTIAGILCSLNLMDSGIISSASVSTMFGDLDFGVGNRYVSSMCLFCGLRAWEYH